MIVKVVNSLSLKILILQWSIDCLLVQNDFELYQHIGS